MHPYPFRGDGPGDGLGFHHGGPGAIGWTVFALQLLLVLGIAWLVASTLLNRAGRRPAVAAGPAAAGGPLEALQLRYARGELARDEYLQARADLDGAEQPRPGS